MMIVKMVHDKMTIVEKIKLENNIEAGGQIQARIYYGSATHIVVPD